MRSSVKRYGHAGRLPREVELKTGALGMQFEEGSLRYICWDGLEVIRMIYAAVRDEAWLTVKPEITGVRVRRKREGFQLSFQGRYRMNEIDFMARFSVDAASNGHLIFRMAGKALTTFRRNRIGFCILHPIDGCSGKTCTIQHPDRTETSSVFPVSVSPHQPFTNVAGMRWNPCNDVTATLDFQGDIFETEDQRNWTDASFKTYCTPLELEHPVMITEGTEISQQVELKITSRLPYHRTSSMSCPALVISNEKLGRLPDIGIGISSRLHGPSAGEGNLIKSLGFSHLQASLFLSKMPLELHYARIREESEKTSLPVELFLFFGDHPVGEMDDFLALFRKAPLPVKSVLILSETAKTTPGQLADEVFPRIRSSIKQVPVGAGTHGNFAQLNRSLPDTTSADFINFAVHPQEHAHDNKSLIENTAGQQDAVSTALQFAGSKPVHVSPVTLRRRFNANVENFEIPGSGNLMPQQVDPRQMSLFAAAWTVGSLKYLLEAGAGSITYFETFGERGILMGDREPQWRGQFAAKKKMIFPVFHVFRMLLNHRNSRIIRSISTAPLVADGFVLETERYRLVFLSNMTGKKQIVRLPGIENSRMLFSLHEGNFTACCRTPEPYGQSILQVQNTGRTGMQFLPFETKILQYQQD